MAVLLQSNLDETNEQVVRLEQIFEAMGEEPAVRESTGMRGLIQECESLISRTEKGGLLDVKVIEAAQKMDHYEICGYGTVQAIAEVLGQQDTADLLEETIEEKKHSDENLWEIAESIFEGADAEYGVEITEDLPAQDRR